MTVSRVNVMPWLSKGVLLEVLKAKKDGRVPEFPKNEEMPPEIRGRKFRLLFMGYFRGQPFWTETAFFYDDEKNRLTLRPSDTPTNQDSVNCIGPASIAKMMYRADVPVDPRLAQYKKLPSDGEPDYTMSVIKAYSDPVASEIDPMCKKIGGHIHVAEVSVTAAKWLIPPISCDLPVAP